MFVSMFLLLSSSYAGKLSEGYRGIPFGENVLSEAPMEACVPGTRPEVSWECETTLGGVPIRASFIMEEGVFYAVSLNGSGRLNADAAFQLAQDSYGEGWKTKDYDTRLPPVVDWMWRDGQVAAIWSYNRFSDTFSLTLADLDLRTEARARVGAAAIRAGGL